MMKILTFSFDEGAKEDLKIAKVLNKNGCKATFFILAGHTGKRKPQEELDQLIIEDMLDKKDIQKLAKHHEIGSHSLTHVNLVKAPLSVVLKEIKKSKDILEDILKKPVVSFSYPYGNYNSQIQLCLKKAGYTCARTVTIYSKNLRPPKDPYAVHPTIMFMLHEAFTQKMKPRKNLSKKEINQNKISLVNKTKMLFNDLLKNEGILHIWGHSWEINAYNLWNEFENICEYVGNNSEVRYLTFSQSIKAYTFSRKDRNNDA